MEMKLHYPKTTLNTRIFPKATDASVPASKLIDKKPAAKNKRILPKATVASVAASKFID